MSSSNDAMAVPPPLYVFLDEGGNLDFSASGTKYFVLTAVWLGRPFPWEPSLHDLRFDLLESGLDIEYFHASEDRQAVRDQVFGLIRGFLQRVSANAVIVEKASTAPALRLDDKFYPRLLGGLLRHIVRSCDIERWSEVIVITDRIPVMKKRHAVEKAVKTTLAAMLPPGIKHRVLHHDSKSCAGLQIADYVNWAVYRAQGGDARSLDPIRAAIRSHFDALRDVWGAE